MGNLKIDQAALMGKVREATGLSYEEKACLLGLLRRKKNYGLLYDPQEEEEAEQKLLSEIPVLREVPERRITDGHAPRQALGHLLIEGDNLHTLLALNYTHRGKIDVIYIDPPYNTGHKDFSYNDEYIDADNAYRHSTWLAFMHKRLSLAKNLLADRGVIFISIDQRELSGLNMLLGEIFTEQNCLGIITLINNMKGRSDDAHFATCNEFMLVYALHPERVEMNLTAIDEEEMDKEYKLADGLSRYKPVGLRKTGKGWRREERKGMYYPVLQRGDEFFSISDEEYSRIYDKQTDTIDDDYVDALCQQYRQQGFTVHLPTSSNGEKGRWRWGFYESFRKYYKTELCVNTEGTLCSKMRNRLEDGSIRGKLAKTVWYKAEYDTGVAGKALTQMFGRKVFEHPKSVTHIKDVLALFRNDITVLDFFAGSGTTMHATMLLNAEDGGHRRCILATNNENGICHNVTYPRCRMAIEGFSLPGGKHAEGLTGNNLRYYTTAFVPREQQMPNMRQLAYQATDMQCIKEDLYEEQEHFGVLPRNEKVYRYFCDGRRSMLIIFREEFADQFAEAIKAMDSKSVPQKIYLFSPSSYALDEAFEDIDTQVVALPHGIYHAYLPSLRKADRLLEQTEEKETE